MDSVLCEESIVALYGLPGYVVELDESCVVFSC